MIWKQDAEKNRYTSASNEVIKKKAYLAFLGFTVIVLGFFCILFVVLNIVHGSGEVLARLFICLILRIHVNRLQ